MSFLKSQAWQPTETQKRYLAVYKIGIDVPLNAKDEELLLGGEAGARRLLTKNASLLMAAPAPGADEESKNVAYIVCLVRILVWESKNSTQKLNGVAQAMVTRVG